MAPVTAVRALLALLLVPALVLAACGDDDVPVAADADTTDPRAGESPGEPVEYLSTSVTEDGAPRPLVDGTRISLRIAGFASGAGTIGASLGCNSLGGDFRLDGDVLVVDGLAQTEMGCDPERHAQDEWFAELLTSRPTLVVDGDGLELRGTTSTVELAPRSAVDPDRPLEGTTWEVTGFLEADAATSIGADAPARVVLDPATSRLVLDDGCNATEIAYEVDGDEIRLGQGGDIEDEGCNPPEYQAGVRALLDPPGARLRWSIDADRLTLRIDDRRAVTLRATT